MRAIRLALVGAPDDGHILTGIRPGPGEPSAWNAVDCDYKCLTGMVRGYMDALAKKDPTRAKLAPNVRFTENNIVLSLGNEGLWKTVTGVAQQRVRRCGYDDGRRRLDRHGRRARRARLLRHAPARAGQADRRSRNHRRAQDWPAAAVRRREGAGARSSVQRSSAAASAAARASVCAPLPTATSTPSS